MFSKLFLRLLVVALSLAALSAPAASAQESHAGDAAHEAHIGTANAGPGLEKPEEYKSDLAIATFVVFMLLLAILWKFAWGPIVAALELREEKVANHIAQAERNHAEARALLSQYEQKLANAANEVRELMEEARRNAEHAKQSILAEAKAGAEAERVRALHDIGTATDQALESLAERSAQLAVDLAGKILQSKLSAADHARLIQDAMAKFPTASSSN